MKRKQLKRLEWHLTPWAINGKGDWKQQPVIVIEGRVPFFADHPQPYIDKLEEMSKDPMLIKGAFHTLSGQFKDALEQSWVKEKAK